MSNGIRTITEFSSMPFHGESAGTSHYRFRISETPCDACFERGYAGSDGTSTAADYCASDQPDPCGTRQTLLTLISQKVYMAIYIQLN